VLPRHCQVMPRFRLAAILLMLGTSCDPTIVGRPCDTRTETSPSSSTLNDQAFECPTRLCLQQAPARTSGTSPDTAPFCTAACTTDADCSLGETRDSGRSSDRRCRLGFTCGVAFSTGATACCRKLCLCRDFLDGPARTPAECDPSTNANLCPLLPSD
jgi:hypothetical protein